MDILVYYEFDIIYKDVEMYGLNTDKFLLCLLF